MPGTQTDRLDGLTTSVAVKAPCKIHTTAAITLEGEQTVNSVALVAGDRVLVKDQADSVDNGIYVVATSEWQRAKDFNGARDAVRGTLVPTFTADGGMVFYRVTSTDNPIVFGTSDITFTIFLTATSGVFETVNITTNLNFTDGATITGNVTYENGQVIFDGADVTFVNGATIDLPDGTVTIDDLSDAVIEYLNSIGAAALTQGTGAVRGVDGYNTTGALDNQFTVSAFLVALIKPGTEEIHVKRNPADITIDIDVAGPIINGRDQAGAFTSSSFVRVYWIYNETTDAYAGIVSAQPPSIGPTLPAGYTHWAYVCTLKIDSSGNLLRMKLVGRDMYYLTTIGPVLSNGNATVETAIDMSPWIPVEALTYQLQQGTAITPNGSGALEFQVFWRVLTGITFRNTAYTLGGLSTLEQNFGGGGLHAVVPNINQNLYYITQTTTGSGIEHNISCGGFSIPNGE